MENFVVPFLLSVAAGVVCHCLCKWLDERVKATSLSVKPCSQYGNKKALQVATLGGFSRIVYGNFVVPFLPPIV